VTTLIANSVSSIFTPHAEYSDKTISFKQQSARYEQGFTFNEVDALKGIYSSTINNYTANFLTGKRLLTSLIDFNLKKSERFTITTTLICNPFIQPVALKINNPTVTSSETRNYSFTTLPPNFDNNFFFELEFLDGKRVRIKHNNGKKDFYLNVYNGEFVVFYNYEDIVTATNVPRSDIFDYLVDDDGYLQLFHNHLGITKVLIFENNKLVLRPIPASGIVRTSARLIKVNYSYNLPISKLNTSWISYDRNRVNALSIDNLRSEFNRDTQYLLHTTYSNTTSSYNLNYMTLNNDRSERGFYKRGTNMISMALNTPDGDYREYTSLHTGVNQEFGNDNFALTFTFFDKDIIAEPGVDTFFRAPSSIYPYDKLNINDTKFTLNGSFGAPTPQLADKIFLQRKNTTQYNNGRYLCTWLSAADTQTKGVWVDRYYYPDALSKVTSHSNAIFNPSFIDVIDQTITLLEAEQISKLVFFDKKSDLTIEPNAKIRYRRTSSSDVNDVIKASSPFVSGFQTYQDINNVTTPYNSQTIIYNGDKYNRYSVSSINKSKEFTVSFELYVDPSKRFGYQLLGNRTSSGFGVYNNTPVTPFIYLKSGNTMHIYNPKYELLSKTVFDEDIKDIIIGEPLEDFFVVCEKEIIYKVNAAGNKTKAKIVPGIGTYISYTQDKESIIFLTPQFNNGISQCIKVDKSSLVGFNVTAQPLPLYQADPFYYPLSLIKYNDTLYTVPGTNVKFSEFNTSEIFYIENTSLLQRYNFTTQQLLTFLKSDTRIWDFTIDENKNIAIIHDRAVSMLKSNRELIYSRNFNEFDTLSSMSLKGIDFIKKDLGVDQRDINIVTVVTTNINNELNFIELEVEDNDVNIDIYNTGLFVLDTALPAGEELRNYTTNYNYNIVNTSRDSTLKFTQTLTNYLSTDDVLTKTYELSLRDIDVGYHVFTYRFDSVQGNITVFVDGIKKTNITFQPGKYKIQDIFTDDFFVGEAGFLNGVSLSTYIDIPGIYFVRNLEMKNFLLYDRALSDTQITALSLKDKPVSSVVLSIPAGQRTNVEEIERMFKYSNTSSSKKVNIFVKNLNIANDDFVKNIKQRIFSQAQEFLPVNVEINDIIFENYK